MAGFLIFMTSFGVLYPSHEALHLHAFADNATGYLPSGTPQLPFISAAGEDLSTTIFRRFINSRSFLKMLEPGRRLLDGLSLL